ncbi:hypothetical protein ADUPG1_012429 [Aduncisulcus paluster]|uniref:Uncharacterized protein n=1 Tax=Aduncisulcus paluster TaxID=2918883 RepID=A0ABQ5JZF2_9EUKA|nr:hypothetical protein ADUPG1_012429 [Aduncisulcus paluster]
MCFFDSFQNNLFSFIMSSFTSIAIDFSLKESVDSQIIKPKFIYEGYVDCCPIPRDSPNIRHVDFPAIKARDETKKHGTYRYDQSVSAREMLKGEWNRGAFTFISVHFSSEETASIQGAYVCLSNISPSHLIFTFTSSKGFKTSKKYVFHDFEGHSMNSHWYFLPVELSDVVLCEITGKGKEKLEFKIQSLVFIREETPEETIARESKEKLWYEAPVVKPEFVKEGDKESEGKDSIPIPRDDPIFINPSFSMVKGKDCSMSKESRYFDQSFSAQKMLKSDSYVSLSHLSIPFPSPSPMKGAYICVHKECSSPSLLFTFIDCDGKKILWYEHDYEWLFLPIDLDNIILCEIEGKGMWGEKRSRKMIAMLIVNVVLVAIVSICPTLGTTALNNAFCSATQCSAGFDDSTFWKYSFICLLIVVVQSTNVSLQTFDFFVHSCVPTSVVFSIVFFFVALFMTWGANLPLLEPVATQEKREGEFRYHHSTVRESMESIAFYAGGEHEEEIANNLLSRAFLNMNRVVHRKLLSIANGWLLDTSSLWLPYVVYFYVFKKDPSCVDSDDFLNNTKYLQNVISACSDLLKVGPGLAALIGITRRVSDLGSVLGLIQPENGENKKENRNENSSKKKSKVTYIKERKQRMEEEKMPLLSDATIPTTVDGSLVVREEERKELEMSESGQDIIHDESLSCDKQKCGWFDVTIINPNGVTLVEDFTYQVEIGKSVIIVGPSGSGKSSLLRVLAGLWPTPKGYASTPSKKTLFVPQTPYLLNRTLAAEITFPDQPPEQLLTDDDARTRMNDILELCELDYLLQRHSLTSVQPWSSILSGGEKQRLGFARLFWHHPQFAVMDESTSALPQELEEKLLDEIVKSGMTLISVAHRRSAIPFHEIVLELVSPSNIQVHSVDKYIVTHPVAVDPSVSLVKEKKYDVPLTAKEAEFDEREEVPAPLGFFQSLGMLISKGIKSLATVEFATLFTVICVTILVPIALAATITVTSGFVSVVSCSDGGDSIDMDKLASLTSQSVMWGFITLISQSIMDFGSLKLGNYMRFNTTKHLHGLYFSNNNFYQVETNFKGIDNSDQRIVADTSLAIYSICGSTVPQTQSLVFGGQGAWIVVIDIVVFMAQLVSVHDWRLVVTPLATFVLFVLVQTLSTYRVKAATAHRQKLEGNFRSVHSRYREFAESIAFYEGEDECRKEAERVFQPLIMEQTRLAGITFWASLTNHILYELAVSILPIIMVYLFEKGIDIQTFQVILADINQILASLCLFLNLAPQFAAFTGTLSRVSQMHQSLENIQITDSDRCEHNPDLIKLTNASVLSPKGETLVKCLDLVVTVGDEEQQVVDVEHDSKIEPSKTSELSHDDSQHGCSFIKKKEKKKKKRGIVIVGPSGVGKSSLLRVIGGLWPIQSNHHKLVRPKDVGSGIFFVPQSPYIIHGASLRAQLVYPHPESQICRTPKHIFSDILKLTELDYLLDRYSLDCVQPWADILSGGEKQRLGFARVLWHNPRFAVMDESTSALPQDLEERLLGKMESRRNVILGPSGVGKSSLLRVIGGLWPIQSNHHKLVRPKDVGSGIFFVPQSPYIIHGASLRAQLVYPHPESQICRTPKHIFSDILKLTELDYLLDRYSLDCVQPWADILSGGEKQRLGFARVLWHNPRFAVMDESTSALPQDLEERLLGKMESRGITMISVAHRKSVIPFHKEMLEVTKEGWKLFKIE